MVQFEDLKMDVVGKLQSHQIILKF